jgi:2-polyprenyl-6-methoxyphenol hydroxylase-like FAD-dependent oxidoreductase
LFLAIALKRRDPRCEVAVFEKRASNVPYGWGIVFWGSLLDRLENIDAQSAAELRAIALDWNGQRLRRNGEVIEREGRGFALRRQELLRVLAMRADSLGVKVTNGHSAHVDALARDADVVAVCDGANSAWRTAHASEFETSFETGTNKYLWVGTEATLETFTFAYRHSDAGWIWFHGYPLDERIGTCVVECTRGAWAEFGFDHMRPGDALAQLQAIFSDDLSGNRFIADHDYEDLPWREFVTVRNGRWHYRNTVLLGDAAHTTHYSIGSGTQLAFDDAITLAQCLLGEHRTEAAFVRYEEDRRPAVLAAQRDAARSAQWFEDIERFASLPSQEFFALLHGRRHRIPRWIPARVYAHLYAAAEKAARLRPVHERT